MKPVLLTVFISLLLINPLHAETLFVNDVLYVPIRTGAGLKYKIINKGVKSGTPLEILENDKATGYAKVRTPNGLEGYLPSRFLTRRPIARQQLAKVSQALSKAKLDISDLSQKVQSLSEKYTNLTSRDSQLSQQLETQTKAFTHLKKISKNALNIDKRNRELRLDNEKLRNDSELLAAENLRLKDNNRTNNWMIGGGLVVLGMIISVILPLFKSSKKSDGWS